MKNLKKIISTLLLITLSNMAYAFETCIHQDGQIVLFALPGCSNPEVEGNWFWGGWEHTDGRFELVCWRYDKMIFVDTDKHGVITFLPSEVTSDCPVKGSKESFVPEEKPYHPAIPS